MYGKVSANCSLVLRDRGIRAGATVLRAVFLLLGVLGLAAGLSPMPMDAAAQGSIFLLVGINLVVVWMMRTGWQLARWEGGVRVGVNAIRWTTDFVG